MIADNKEKGSAFILTVLLAMLILSITIGYLSLLMDEIQLTRNQYNCTQAQYLAEAGAVRALQQVKEDPDYLKWFPPWLATEQSLGKGDYQVNLDFSPSENVIFLTSRGRIPAGSGLVVNRQLLAQIHFFQAVFNYSLFAGQGIQGEQSQVIGDIASLGESMQLTNCLVTGSIVNNSKLAIPFLVEEDYNTEAKAWPVGKDIQLKGGVYLVKGDLTLPSTAKVQGRALVYVRGEANLQGKVQGKVAFVAGDDIVVGGGSSLEQVLLYSRKNIYLGENVLLKGCLVAREQIKFNRGCQIEYFSPYTVTNWEYKT